MKKQTQKLILASFAFICCLSAAFGQTTVKEITDKFFSIYATDPAKAIDYGFSTNKWLDIKQDDIVNLKTSLAKMAGQCGKFIRYELMSEKSAGENIKSQNFIVFYDREPIHFTFLFYRPDNTWRLYNFSYTENLDADLK